MKKMCKVILLVSIFIGVMLFNFTVIAFANDSKGNELYSDNIGDIYDNLDDETKEILDSLGISGVSLESVADISLKSVFRIFVRLFKGSLSEPAGFMCTALGIIMISAVAGCFISEKSGMRQYFDTVPVLFISLLVTAKIIGCVSDAVSSLYSVGVLMKMLVPALAVITSFSGSPTAAVSYNAVTVYCAEIICAVCEDFLSPLLCIFAAVSVCCAVGGQVKIKPLLEMIKKAVNTVLGLFGVVFTGVIAIKDTLSAGADKVSMKGVKFVLGSAVPIVGGSLGDGLSSVVASISLMKNTYAVFGVIVIAAVVLPVICEILLWLCSLSLSSYIADALGQSGIASVLSSLKFVLSVLISIILFCVYIFIISTAMVVLLAGK